MTGNRRKPWSTKRGETLGDDLDLLIGDLCVQWGFCNRLCGDDLLRSGGAIDAEAFAVAVLRAEAMEPEIETKWRRAIGRAFVERYGQSQVSESSYETA
jgi:hypothetical protein